MRKTLWISSIVVLVGLILVGIHLNTKNAQEAASRQSQVPAQPQSESPIPQNNQSDSNDLWAGFGSYKDYSPATVKAEFEAGRKVVLFFHAPWCPYCIAANTAFLEKTDQIPQGVTVLKTDYDSNSDLKKKYGVTYQHTFVQIDANGDMVTKWNGGDVDNLIKNLK